MKLRQRHEGFLTWIWSAFAFYPASSTAILVLLLAVLICITALSLAIQLVKFVVIAVICVVVCGIIFRWVAKRLD